MSDHVCLICEHGPHRQTACKSCGCATWVNAAVAGFRSNVQLQQMSREFYSRVEEILANMLELMIETNPEAVKVIDARREEVRRQLEEQAASQQQRAEADQAGQDAPPDSTDSPENIQGAEI